MNIADIISLAGAGFTKDEITRLAGIVQTQSKTHNPHTTETAFTSQISNTIPSYSLNQNPSHVMYQPTSTPTPTPTLAPTPATDPVTVPNPIQQYMPTPQPNGVDFGNKLDQILGAVQGNNIMNMQVPSQPTTDDMLAEIINPKGVE